MDKNKNLRNNLAAFLKTNNQSSNKNKKFSESFFNLKSKLSYEAATDIQDEKNIKKTQIINNIPKEENEKELSDIKLLNKKILTPFDEPKTKTKNKTEEQSNKKNNLILKLEQNRKLVHASELQKEHSLINYNNNSLRKKWKLYRTIAGHTGWVRCIDIDPSNNWFVTGSNDRVIKFWDLASGKLKLSFTGHINSIRSVVISKRHPYLFSCGEDKLVKCWDLETNKAIRQYHGHLNGVYCLSLHPNLDIFTTGGRDCVARVWDIKSRQQIMCLEGHSNTVYSVVMQENEPQIITGSSDNTIKLWDIRNGNVLKTLTHHKKSIRSIVIPEEEYSFISAGADDIKVWKCPEGKYLRSLSADQGIINSVDINKDGILVSGGEYGNLFFWDYYKGEMFQKINTPAQPGSLECESQIFGVKFDMTSTRLITVGCDKTIKMWKQEDEEDDLYENNNKRIINLDEKEESEEEVGEDK